MRSLREVSERWNRVRIGTATTSDWRKTERGCPQGSNFGPLMWNIVKKNPMYNMQFDKCSAMMDANDHQVYTSGERIEEVESIPNYEGKGRKYQTGIRTIYLCVIMKNESRVET